MSQKVIAAMHPFLEREHLQPVGMTVASCRFPSIVAQLKAPNDLLEAAT
jgi:hypothetical protein